MGREAEGGGGRGNRGRCRPTAERRGVPGGERGRPRGERGTKTPEPTAGAERGGGAREGAPSPLESPTIYKSEPRGKSPTPIEPLNALKFRNINNTTVGKLRRCYFTDDAPRVCVRQHPKMC